MRKGYFRSGSVLAMGAVVFGLSTGAALAAPADAEGGGGTVSELVVTAERREQSLQKVPLSVAAVSDEKLKSAGVQNFADLQYLTPSLNITEAGPVRFINIRGIGVGVSTPFQFAGVPLHLDGMYVPRSEFFLRDAYFDLERVEVYRGPQGTFAGQNSTGGAIFITSRQPQFDGFGAEIQQLVGNYNWFQTQGWVNMPISDEMAVRVAFNAEQRDSFFTNLGPGGPGLGSDPNVSEVSRPGNVDRYNLRSILRWQPTDRFEARLRFDYTHDYNDGVASVRGRPNSFNDPDAIIDPFVLNYDTMTYSKQDLYRGMLNLNWDVADGIELRSITGAQFIGTQSLGDVDATSPYVPDRYSASGAPVSPQTYAPFRNTDNYWFQEIDLVSTSPGPLKWVVGAVAFTQVNNLYNHTHSYNVNNCASPPTRPVCTTPEILSGGNVLDYFQKTESWAGFGEATYNVTDQLQLIAGLRYTYYRIDLEEGSTVRSGTPPFPLLTSCGGPCNVSGRGQYERFSGRFAVNWFVNDDTTLYATYSQGMKPGAFFSQFTLGMNPANPSQYKSETVRNYEAGIKATLFDRHVRANLSGFYEDYRDYQAQFAIPGTVVPRAVNIPKSRIMGGEAEISLAFGDFRADLNAAYVDTEILVGTNVNVTTSYYAPNCPNAALGAVGGLAQCPAGAVLVPLTFRAGPPASFTFNPEGLPLNYAPKWTVNAALEYDFHVGGGTLTPRIQYGYIGEQWASLYHASQDFQPSRHQFDLRLTYRAPEHWRVEAFVLNATDELAVVGVQPAANAANASAGTVGLLAPRQYGVRVGYTY